MRIEEYARIASAKETYVPYIPGLPYISVCLRADREQDNTHIELADWYTAMGNIGGFAGFWGLILAAIFGVLAEIDFIAFAAKKLYMTKVKYKDFLLKRT